MKIQKIKIQNIGNLDSLEADVKGQNLIAIGKNGVGKSSVIDTLFEVLQGRYSKPNSVKKGKAVGVYEIDLGEWIANFTFKPEQKTADLKLTTKSGATVSQAKTTLSGVVGILDFDIDEFLGLSDTEKVKYLFKHIDLGVSPEQLAAIDKERQEFYDERTIVNRDIDVAKKTLIPPTPEDIETSKKEVKPVSELYEKKTKIVEINQKIEYVENGLEQKRQEIEEIETEIKRLLERKEVLNKQVKDGEEYLSKNKKKDPSEIDAEIQSLESENEEIKEAKDLVDKFNALEENLKSDLESQKEINEKIAEIDDMKKNMIIEGLEIEGLDYDPVADRFVFGKDRLSLNELNEAQRYLIGIQIGAKQLKKVRIMRFSANALDNDSLKTIMEFGKNKDIQFFVEMMDRDKEELEIQVTESL